MRDHYTAAEFVRGMREMRDDTERRIAKWLQNYVPQGGWPSIEEIALMIEQGEYRD